MVKKIDKRHAEILELNKYKQEEKVNEYYK